MKKLAKIQSSLICPKDQYNSFGKYNYRSCEQILEAVKPLLDGAVLTLSDEIVDLGGRIYAKATATFIDDDFRMSTTAYAREEETKKGMDAAQITGACSSYARKYALAGLFLLDDNKDADTMDNKKPEKDFTPQFEETKPPKADPPKQEGTVAPQTHDGLDQKQQQSKIAEWLLVICGNNDAAADKLEEITTWTNGKGETVKGKRNPFQLNVKPNAKGQTQTSVTYSQVRKMHEEFINEEAPF